MLLKALASVLSSSFPVVFSFTVRFPRATASEALTTPSSGFVIRFATKTPAPITTTKATDANPNICVRVVVLGWTRKVCGKEVPITAMSSPPRASSVPIISL